MYKILFSTIWLITLSPLSVNAEETRTYNQPPVITGEFTVEQEDQKALANLEKDTDKIHVESDFLGLKKFANETFNTQKIKQRYDEGLSKLREDESSIKSGERH